MVAARAGAAPASGTNVIRTLRMSIEERFTVKT